MWRALILGVVVTGVAFLIGTLIGSLHARRLDRRRTRTYWINRRIAERDHYVAQARQAAAIGGLKARAPRRSDYRTDWELAFAVHRMLVGPGVPYGLDLVVDKRLGRQVLEGEGLVHLAVQLRHDGYSTPAFLCDPDRLAPDPRWERDARRVTCLWCVARDP